MTVPPRGSIASPARSACIPHSPRSDPASNAPRSPLPALRESLPGGRRLAVPPPVWQTERVPQSVLGEELQPCSYDPLTGWFRDGCCNTDSGDFGVHTVCAVLTEEFLEFSASVGNDLSTPRPEFGFEGLHPGDRWCLCASRWAEALEAGAAPPVILEATHARTLEWIGRSDLESHRFEPTH